MDALNFEVLPDEENQTNTNEQLANESTQNAFSESERKQECVICLQPLRKAGQVLVSAKRTNAVICFMNHAPLDGSKRVTTALYVE